MQGKLLVKHRVKTQETTQKYKNCITFIKTSVSKWNYKIDNNNIFVSFFLSYIFTAVKDTQLAARKQFLFS